MNSIILKAQTTVAPEDAAVKLTGGWMDPKVEWAAEGISVTRSSWVDKDGVTHEVENADIGEEVAPVRPYSFENLADGIVACIGGRCYRILVTGPWQGDRWPEGATVHFYPTDAPETPWAPWDGEAAKAERIAWLRKEIVNTPQYEATESFVKHYEDQIRQHYEDQIRQLESGEWRLRPDANVLLFGKPAWIQSPMLPAHENKAARCLMVLETGWGDSGNINLLFTVDANGVPNKVWFEASCC